MKEDNEKLEQIISRLLSIKKDELTEREFFHAVINEINNMTNMSLSWADNKRIGDVLRSIGGMEFKQWEEEKILEGKIIKDTKFVPGAKNGSIVFAAEAVGRWIVLGNNNITVSFEQSCEVGRDGFSKIYFADLDGKANLYEVWLKNSQRIIDEDREDEWLIKVPEDEELINEEQRKQREKIIQARKRISERRRLTKEIEDIKNEIQNLEELLYIKENEYRKLKYEK